MPPGSGDAVRLALTKWGGRPHWAFDATMLGSDEHGDWIGLPAGTPMARPGAALVTETDQVGLLPRAGSGGAGAWMATFHAPGYVLATYVDMTTPPVWDGATCRAVDLDLDVVETSDGRVFVDDEDEFAEHQVTLGYPPEVVAMAEAARDWVHTAVLTRRAPFDGSADAWFARVPRPRPAGGG